MIRRVIVVLSVAIATLTMSAGSANAAEKTTCSSGYYSDRVVSRAYTDKSGHLVGAQIDGIDYADHVNCVLGNTYPSEHIVDIYRSGGVYKYANGSYSLCYIVTGKWMGYFNGTRVTWGVDLDGSHISPSKCGWSYGPIKVRNYAKGQWDNGTVKTVTTIVTDSRL
ncbi:hypothetical protein [Nocardioides sp. NPDC127503]|uniref:hypothetical protein n=1 Tax=Nocardioides sp. NPDC127503 TaxID=3154516 RepID=UPI00332BA78F